MQIIPAILPNNQTDLNTKSKSVLDLVSYIQIDICDGVFVPAKTQFNELPYLEVMEYELDLMIDQPEIDLQTYIDMGCGRVVIHLESVRDMDRLIKALNKIRGIVEIGFCIGNDTDNSVLVNQIQHCDFIQFMGIDTIGVQSQPFDQRVLEKINYFHSNFPEKTISIDGCVNTDTIIKLRDAGASRFVVGSFLYGGDVGGNYKTLTELLSE